MKRLLVRLLAAVVILGVAFLGFAYWYDSVGQRPDLAFDTTVARPAYTAGTGPRVAFDVAHRNWHTPSGRYGPFAALLRSDGYRVTESNGLFTAAALDSTQVLVVANAMGPDDHEGRPAFTEVEEQALVAWVERGGALLLIADHVPFGAAAERLAQRFGVTMYLSYARDDEHHAGWDNERLRFTRADGLLPSSPIADGRDSTERVERVVTFTGQSLSLPAGATPLLAMGPDGYDWESRSVRHSAAGHVQGLAMAFGRGRVVVLGEAGLLSAQKDPLGCKMGMNAEGNDDRQLALNVLHWLSGALNQVRAPPPPPPAPAPHQ